MRWAMFIILGVAAGLTVGTAYGNHITDHFTGDVKIDGQLIVDNKIVSNDNIVTKGGGTTVFNTITNTDRANNFKFVHTSDTFQEFQLRQVTAGDKFQIYDKTNNQIGVSMNSNGNIGVLTGNPTQEVDINGDVRFRQDLHLDNGVNILSNGDICIGACP